jgi:succinate dehydrogenase flavin-adding protein (antitoxin of CptAB toxin-antitoxin module)
VIGLSKYARLVDWIMGRPQIQEEAVVQLADLIMEKTQPDGLAVVMEASHFCMSWRGVREMDSKMLNSVMRGAFLKDANLRREFLSLIPGRTDPCWYACSTPAARSTPRPRPSKPFFPSRASTTLQWPDRRAVLRRRRVSAGHRGRTQAVSDLFGT